MCDVGASWNYLGNDVTRAFPVNGKFTGQQKILYECAYNISEYMFRRIRPGLPMSDIDKTIRQVCSEQLRDMGLVNHDDEVSKILLWHGGAHHVGFDTHDVVDISREASEGMVFCADVGIYCEEWGIGFRLADNCLVTDEGCENLPASISRSIQDIEAEMTMS